MESADLQGLDLGCEGFECARLQMLDVSGLGRIGLFEWF